MGFTPAQVQAMTLWEFSACVGGFIEANGGEIAPNYATDEEFAQALRSIH